MKKMSKIIAMGVIIIMSLGFFAGCSNDYTYKEGDFNLTIEVDRTEVQVGDTIMVTARLENLSDRDVRVQMSHTRYKKLEDMLLIGLFAENAEKYFDVTSEAGPLSKLTIKKNSIVIRSMQLQITDNENCVVVALAVFKVGKDYKDSVPLYSEYIKINIKGEN